MSFNYFTRHIKTQSSSYGLPDCAIAKLSLSNFFEIAIKASFLKLNLIHDSIIYASSKALLYLWALNKNRNSKFLSFLIQLSSMRKKVVFRTFVL